MSISELKQKTDKLARGFIDLVELVEHLRGPGGCPWDRAQKANNLRTYILEEVHEVIDAIGREDYAGLSDELGDLLFQVLFITSLASEEGHFDLEHVLASIKRKMIHRHPHVFRDDHADSPGEVVEKWDRIKEKERRDSQMGKLSPGILAGLPKTFPALYHALKISSKAARVGFDWPGPDQVLEKLTEELGELQQARKQKDASSINHEIGDLLFVVVNLARHLEVDPEQALRDCNRRFIHRFNRVEEWLRLDGDSPATTDLKTMESLWRRAKNEETGTGGQGGSETDERPGDSSRTK